MVPSTLTWLAAVRAGDPHRLPPRRLAIEHRRPIGHHAAGLNQRRAPRGRHGCQHRRGLRLLRRRDDRHAGFDDARLLPGDLCQRVAEQGGVFQAQGGDDRHLRQHHVGGVEPAAEPDLDHRPVHAGLLEGEERQHRVEIEVGQRPLDRSGVIAFSRRPEPRGDQLGDGGFADRHAVEPDPLPGGDQMR